MEIKAYNLPNRSKTISICYQKDFDPISRGHDLYIYYMIKLYLYTIYHNQLYTMNPYKIHTKSYYQGVKVYEFILQIHKLFSFVNYA
jgi:hypothetical protein